MLSQSGERAHLNPLYRDIALRWSHYATLDENQEDKLELEWRRNTEYTHLDENQEDKLVLSSVADDSSLRQTWNDSEKMKWTA